MSDASSNKIAVLVHHNNEVTVLDERGLPRLCRDCRHSGWLTEWERHTYTHPKTCLLYSGGADTLDGDRVIFDNVTGLYRYRGETSRRSADHDRCAQANRKNYPLCGEKNPDGKCEDYIRAKSLAWWGNFWRKLFGREWRTRRMRE